MGMAAAAGTEEVASVRADLSLWALERPAVEQRLALTAEARAQRLAPLV